MMKQTTLDEHSKTYSCKAVLFDLDGVLVDSTASVEYAWNYWAERHGLDVKNILAIAHGRRSIETMRLIAPEIASEQEAEELNLIQAQDTSRDVAVPGAAALLAALPPQQWAIVTSGPPFLAKARLKAVGLPQPALLVTGEDVLHGKPYPDGYVKAAHQLGIAPEDCLVFEDAPSGIAAGLAAGIRVIAVATTYPLGELPKTVQAIQTLAEVHVEMMMVSFEKRRHPELVLTIGT
jgi:sugar-phosphatase